MTGDAGNCSAATAAEIHGLGGDYVLQVKGNQPTLLQFCGAAFAGLPRPAPVPRKGHGRLTLRTLRAAPALPMATGIPFSRAVVCLETRTLCKGAETSDTLHYVTDRDLRGATPEDLDELLSTHWRSSESATHWIRDAQYREDFCRMRNPVAILNRSLLINACAFITNTLRVRKKTSTPALREKFGRRPSLALRLLTNPFDARLDP